jgi:hypothetical protein
VYVALLTLFVIAGELRNLSHGGALGAITIADWVLTAALLAADWCYALQKPLGERWYWRAVFWIVVFATAVMLVPVALGGTAAIVFTVALLALVVPAYVAAFLYAYRSPQLWPPEEESPA